MRGMSGSHTKPTTETVNEVSIAEPVWKLRARAVERVKDLFHERREIEDRITILNNEFVALSSEMSQLRQKFNIVMMHDGSFGCPMLVYPEGGQVDKVAYINKESR